MKRFIGRRVGLADSSSGDGRPAMVAGCPRACGRQEGFTLIETTIAMLVMMVAVLSIASLYDFANRYNSGGRDRALATAVAQKRLEQLRSLPFSDPQLAATAPSAPRRQSASINGRTLIVSTQVTDLPGSAPEPTTVAVQKNITVTVRPVGGQTWSTPVVLSTTRSAQTLGPYRF